MLRHEDYSSLPQGEVFRTLAPSSNLSSPCPDHIPYSVWKSLHRITPSLLPSLLDPLLAHGFHPPSPKKALGIVLDKPGKPGYNFPSCFSVIVLLLTLPNILKRIAALRLSRQAVTGSLIYPLQCGFLPGRSTVDATLVLQQHVQSLHRLCHKVSTLFQDIKGGFDNVESSILLSLLHRQGMSTYLIQWISSFLRDRTCRLAFHGSPHTFAPVSVGIPQGSPISPLLLVMYMSSLHTDIANCLTISYLDDFAVRVVSPSYRTNVPLLQRVFSALKRKVSPHNISFSIPKTELMPWGTARENQTPCCLPVDLEGQVFYPQNCLTWLALFFNLSFDPSAHFSHRLSLANGAFPTIRRLLPSGIGLPLHLCLTLIRFLLAPILLYGSAVWYPPPSSLDTMVAFL